jgi:site-specific DNA-methyltransferase (cytosine-N4-specific)
LRDYGVDGQYGAERTPADFVANLAALFVQLHRVLADDGTLWLNVGDSYSTPKRGSDNGWDKSRLNNPARVQKMQFAAMRQGREIQFDRPTKSLLGIPWRIAFALQDDGWILRQEIIWAKANCMPEAVTDRPSRNHEQVFLFSKRARYWYDAVAIREESDAAQTAHNERYAKVYDAQASRAATTGQPGNENSAGIHARPGAPGRNARSVWRVNTQPFPEAHFATMPVTLAERCILAGCKPGGIVLDPFSGSGTTGLAATRNGRRYVGIDLNADYLDLSLRTRLAQSALGDGAA